MAADSGVRARWALARGVGVVALVLALGTPPAAWLQGIPDWLDLPVLQRMAVAAAAVLLLLTGAASPVQRRIAVATAVLGSVGFAAGLAAAGVQPSASPGLLLRWAAICPPPLVLAGVVLFAAVFWFLGRDAQSRVAPILNMAAAAVFFLVWVGHLYGAAALIRPPGVAPSHLLACLLLLALSLAGLGLHNAGPLLAYAGADPGAVARRRLLPAAVLAPIVFGYVLVFALDGERLSPKLAVALTVFANVLVMLVLINAAGNKVARVAWDRQRRMEAREAQVRKQGLRDPLTQLLNRRGWDGEIEVAEKLCRRDGIDACVLVIDLDGLKQINDTEGHKAGDGHIQRAAAALRKAARRGEPLARLGGDEFAYLVVDCEEPAAQEVVTRFEQVLRQGRIRASLGYAMRGSDTLAAAFEEADAAMYQQKRARKLKQA